MPRSGDVIADRYKLGDLLGIGGMGMVYAAVQRTLDRTVALKLAHPQLVSDASVREHFRIEALAGSRIDHRNVVRVLDYGNAEGTPFIVMEHVAGPRLAELLVERGPLPIPVATALVRQVLDGLAAVHAHRIVHADVKCDNILVHTHDDGTTIPRLIDFGIAHFVDDPWLGERTVSGTPEYLAPELLRGEPPTFASDVYAAGVLLFELVTGATPFVGATNGEILTRQLAGEPAPLSSRIASHSDELDEVVGRALALVPSDRYADAAAFGAALGGVSSASPPAALGTDRRSRVARRRDAVGTAILKGDVEAIVVAYLQLASVLIDEHELAVAISELEEGIQLLAGARQHAALWRLMLSLATLYAGHGDRAKARAATRTARTQAAAAGSTVGCNRAEQLWRRLACSDQLVRTW
jgi:eukaryotic-like serine/threonine-protein kinase